MRYWLWSAEATPTSSRYGMTGLQFIREQVAFWKENGAPDECVEWPRARHFYGYGLLTLNKKRMRAHLVAWELWNDRAFPSGLRGTHSCDNPPCYNPTHIVPDTQGGNIRQAYLRGRMVAPNLSGEQHGMAKLTWEQVRYIRRRYAEGVKQTELAKEMNMRQGAISNIVLHKIWKEPVQ